MSIEVYRILVRLSFFLELSPKKTHAKTHTYTHMQNTGLLPRCGRLCLSCAVR